MAKNILELRMTSGPVYVINWDNVDFLFFREGEEDEKVNGKSVQGQPILELGLSSGAKLMFTGYTHETIMKLLEESNTI